MKINKILSCDERTHAMTITLQREHGMTLVYCCGTGHLLRNLPKIPVAVYPQVSEQSFPSLHQMLLCLKHLVQVSVLRQRSYNPLGFFTFPEKDWNTPVDANYLSNTGAANGNYGTAVNAVKRPGRPTGNMTSQIFSCV